MSAKELCLHVSASQGNYSVNGVAILTRVFLQKKCMVVFVRLPKKVAVMTRWP